MKRKITTICALLGSMAATGVDAQHKTNPGPADFEIKFKVPTPQPLNPQEALKTFAIQKGYRVELVAAEPLIEAPVAISFDEKGRLYVVEMRGYMHDIQGTTEGEKTGRVSLLEDTDGDGVMDKSTVFVDDLVMPRSVLAVRGGAIVSEPPNLTFYQDTDGDGVADKKEVISSDYGQLGGQPEHMANTPLLAMDNFIWSCKYDYKFRWSGGAWMKTPGLSRGQYGLVQDNVGRLFYNYNSDFLRADLLQSDALSRNPMHNTPSSLNHRVVTDQTVWPAMPTPGVNRGYEAKSLRADGTLMASTATCSPLIYRGDLLPNDARGNAFIPEPAGNLIKRFNISEVDGVVRGENVLKDYDFMTSTDERFRPVFMADGPDGAIYVVDMYRGIIQHSSFLTHYLIANIEQRKLTLPLDMGRIWKIVPDTAAKPQVTKIAEDSAGRVAQLAHPNGWVRDQAQRLLVESEDKSVKAALQDMVAKHPNALARLHALWTLEGLTLLNDEILKVGFNDADAHVRAVAVRLSSLSLLKELRALKNEQEAVVLAQLVIKFSQIPLPDAFDGLVDVASSKAAQKPLVIDALLSGIAGIEGHFVRALMTKHVDAQVQPMLYAVARMMSVSNQSQTWLTLLDVAAQQPAKGVLQKAIVSGLGQDARKTSRVIWMDAEPASLSKLRKDWAGEKAAEKWFKQIDSRLQWEGKPGAPQRPVVPALTAQQQARYEAGKQLYAMNCAACHQNHGMGLDGLAPPLVDSEWVNGNPEVGIRIVLQGMAGPIKVNNRNFDLAMPPLVHLNDEQVASILTYIRREWDHIESPVEPDQVSRVRKEHAQRYAPWTDRELRPLLKK